jgi:hypothetical protein
MAIKFDRGRVELLGVEIIFTGEDDPRGSVWVPIDETMSIIYGKNGAGKSTILKAISSFVRGLSLEDEGILVHGYARLIDPASSCSIMDQAIRNMPNTGFLNEWDGLERSEIEQKFSEMSAGLELPYERWESSLFSAVPESVDDLDVDWSKFVSHLLFLGLWEHDIRYQFEGLKNVANHLINSRIICLRPNGQEDGEWQLTLAALIETDEIREAYEDLLANTDEYIFPGEFTSPVGQILLDTNILAHRSKMPRTNSPYVATANIASQKISSLEIALVDLDHEMDLNEWTKARVAELIHSSWITVKDSWFSDYSMHSNPTSPFMTTEHLEENTDDEDFEELIWLASFGSKAVPSGHKIIFQFHGERQEILQKALTFIATELPSELAISDLRLKLQTDLGLWIYGSPAIFEALDKRSDSWIPVKKTSSTTQKVIGMALKIHSDIRSTNQTVIAIGDEIDRGMHARAIENLYKMLADSIPTCFVTSHSPAALSTRLGDRLHVHRDSAGGMLLGSLSNSEISSSSAMQLGVTTYDLIGAIDLVVAVEGQHDKLVIEHFMKKDQRFSNRNVQIFSMTGINNATNLLDSEFALSYSDLQILVIADNSSKTDLVTSRDDAQKKIRNGQAPTSVASSLRRRAKGAKAQHWHEQRCMFDLLALATERNLLDRILISGHTYMDIETSLHHELFGLEKDWLELEAEYRNKRRTEKSFTASFKDYLRSTYEVSIEMKTIEAALDMTPRVPDGIQLVLNDIFNALDGPLWESLRQ